MTFNRAATEQSHIQLQNRLPHTPSCHCEHSHLLLQLHALTFAIANTHICYCKRSHLQLQAHTLIIASTHMCYCRPSHLQLQTRTCATAAARTHIRNSKQSHLLLRALAFAVANTRIFGYWCYILILSTIDTSTHTHIITYWARQHHWQCFCKMGWGK